MTLSYKYKIVPRSNNINASSPSIPMTLSSNGGKYEFMVLIDSGADVSAIPEHVADLLGVDLKGDEEKTYGIGGEAIAIESKVNVEFGKNHEVYSFEIPVKVILGEYDFPPLIGRAGFFDRFNITFKQSEKRVLIKEAMKKLY